VTARCAGVPAIAILTLWLGCGSEPTSIADQKDLARIVGSIPDPPMIPEVPPEAERNGVDDILADFGALCDWEKTACEVASKDCFDCIGDVGLSRACREPCGRALGACEAAAICFDGMRKMIK
jgi:hypothetical protein